MRTKIKNCLSFMFVFACVCLADACYLGRSNVTSLTMPFASAVFDPSPVGHKASLENRSVGKSTHQHLQTLLGYEYVRLLPKDTHPCR